MVGVGRRCDLFLSRPLAGCPTRTSANRKNNNSERGDGDTRGGERSVFCVFLCQRWLLCGVLLVVFGRDVASNPRLVGADY